MERWRWGDRIERRELEEVGSKEANAAVVIRCAASVRQGGMRHQMRRLQGRRGLFNWHGSSKEATAMFGLGVKMFSGERNDALITN